MKAIPFLLLILLQISAVFGQVNQSKDSRPVIDASHWKMSKSPFAIKGQALFFDQALLSPAECQKEAGRLINFPSLFPSHETEQAGIGYGTYQIHVIMPSEGRDFALAMPQIYSSYKLWINDSLVAENGVVGRAITESKPQWRPQTVAFQTESDTLTLVLQVANFNHAKGGIKELIFLGSSSMMKFQRSVAVTSQLTETAVLFTIGLFFLFIFFFKLRNKAVIYFALLALTWSVRSVFSNLYLFISFYPDFNWNSMVRIEYISLYLEMIWAILFLTSLFHHEANIIIKYGLVFCNVLFTAFTFASTPRLFTQGLTVYLIASGILLLYGCYIVIRAWANERTGSGLLTLSFILAFNIFAYDIFVYEGFSAYDPVIFSAGYITIFIMISFALAFHVGLIKTKQNPATSLRYEDLYKE